MVDRTRPAPVPATLYRDAALADGRSPSLRRGISVLVRRRRIVWIRPSDDEGPREGDVDVIDASGSTIVPGMVDCHSHLTLPGGAHWLEHVDDAPERLLDTAEHNGRLMTQAGVRWARDVGAPVGRDPATGAVRALSFGVRERWRRRRDRPIVRAAGAFIERPDGCPPGVDATERIVAIVHEQIDHGAPHVKLYPESGSPQELSWSDAELAAAVAAAHSRGARATAHASSRATTAACARAGVDSMEHGMELDDGTVRLMVERSITLVSTLAVFRSWMTFARTTSIPRFTSQEGRRRIGERRDAAMASVRLAHRAGVLIAAGTDFGGGSTRANQLAWEVECLVEAGLEPWEALAAATWHGGILLGEPDAGSLREGGRADFALVHGDPLSDPTALWRVWRVSWAS